MKQYKSDFPKKGSSFAVIEKFLLSHGYKELKGNGSSHFIFVVREEYKGIIRGKGMISISTHRGIVTDGTWRNCQKDYEGIPH